MKPTPAGFRRTQVSFGYWKLEPIPEPVVHPATTPLDPDTLLRLFTRVDPAAWAGGHE